MKKIIITKVQLQFLDCEQEDFQWSDIESSASELLFHTKYCIIDRKQPRLFLL